MLNTESIFFLEMMPISLGDKGVGIAEALDPDPFALKEFQNAAAKSPREDMILNGQDGLCPSRLI